MTDPASEPIPDQLNVSTAPSPSRGTDPEARGPHLPDRVTRLGAYVWGFLLLAAARLIWFIRESSLVDPLDPATVVTYAASILPSIVILLLPAALLLRHPDAADRARTLLLGTVLFTIVEGMRVLNPPLQPIFEQLTPGSAETPYLVPLALVYDGAISLLGSYALANIALGLARARRYEDPPGSRIVAVLMVVAVSLVAVGGVVSVSQLPLDEIPMTITVILYLISTVLLSVAFAAAWAYLAAVTIRGARAGELPESGWLFAAIGSGLVIAAYVVRSTVLFTATPTPDTQALFSALGQALTITVALGYVGLLVGLLLGLPSLDAVDEDLDEAVDADDVDEAGADVAPVDEAIDGSAGAEVEPA